LSFGGFPLAIILFVLLSPKENDKRTNNKMAKGKPPKDKQYNGQRKNAKRTTSIMAKGIRQKDKQYNGQRKTTKGQTI
jgi:hypothetical protein